jgi:hypothetical protein
LLNASVTGIAIAARSSITTAVYVNVPPTVPAICVRRGARTSPAMYVDAKASSQVMATIPSVSRSVTPPGIPAACAPETRSWNAVGEPPADSASLFRPEEKSLSLENTKTPISSARASTPRVKLIVWNRK